MIPGSKRQWMPHLFISWHQFSSEHSLALGCEESNIIHRSRCPALLWAAPGLLWPSGPGKSPVFSSREAGITAVRAASPCQGQALASCHLSLPRQAGLSDAPLSCLALTARASARLPRPACWVTNLQRYPHCHWPAESANSNVFLLLTNM